jgi:hypothetical protein
MLGGAYMFFEGSEALAAEATALVFSAPIFLSCPRLHCWERRSAGDGGARCWSGVHPSLGIIIAAPVGIPLQPASLYVIGTAGLYALLHDRALSWPRESMWTMMFFVMLFPRCALCPPLSFRSLGAEITQFGDLPFLVARWLCLALGITLIGPGPSALRPRRW